ncbi:MAG: F0F1 ATP synthase subunit delta [Firmicutes bacterium]|nr:F0F1 ATP synthase subunit delta [Bacillota bacterium]
MIKNAVARRYAEALVEVASGANLLDEIEEQFRSVVEVIEDDKELTKLLADPKVLPDRKKDVLQKLFGEKTNPYLLNTLKILVDKKRTDHLKAIFDQYVELANEARGIVVAHVTTAREPDGDECEELKKRLKEVTGKDIRLDITVDPNLIGGAKVRIGDTVIDASVTNKLAGLERTLSSIRFDADVDAD